MTQDEFTVDAPTDSEAVASDLLTLADLPCAAKLINWIPEDIDDIVDHLDDLIDAMIESTVHGISTEGMQLGHLANHLNEARRDELLKHTNQDTGEIQVSRSELNIVFEGDTVGRELYRSAIADQLLLSCESSNTRILSYISSITLAYLPPDEEKHPKGVLGATIEWVRPVDPIQPKEEEGNKES